MEKEHVTPTYINDTTFTYLHVNTCKLPIYNHLYKVKFPHTVYITSYVPIKSVGFYNQTDSAKIHKK